MAGSSSVHAAMAACTGCALVSSRCSWEPSVPLHLSAISRARLRCPGGWAGGSTRLHFCWKAPRPQACAGSSPSRSPSSSPSPSRSRARQEALSGLLSNVKPGAVAGAAAAAGVGVAAIILLSCLLHKGPASARLANAAVARVANSASRNAGVAGDGRDAAPAIMPVPAACSSAFFVHGAAREAADVPPAYSMLVVGDPVAGSVVRNRVSVFVASKKQEQEVEEGEGEDEAFAVWLEAVKDDAAKLGVSREILESALEGVTVSRKILFLKENQPEVKLSAQEYLGRMVSEYRVAKGVTSFLENEELLQQVASTYGVPAPVLAAIWGVESSYGGFPGNWDVIQALVTMAYKGEKDPRRAAYFRRQVIDALLIMHEGHGPPGGKRLVGSWAGAMGQCQFMPDSFLKFAVDYDGDGRKDIWESRPDVFASMANFLSQHGWKEGAPIAQKVVVPKKIDKAVLGLNVKKPVREWKRKYSISKAEGEPELLQDDMVSLVAPDGPSGVAYLVCDNFRTIMRYNPSSLYSLAILQLAQLISQRSGRL